MKRNSVVCWVLLGAPLLLLAYGCSSDFSDCSDLRACPNAGAAGIAGAPGSSGGSGLAGAPGTNDSSSGGSAGQSAVEEAGAAGESNAIGDAGSAGADGSDGSKGGSGGNSANAGGAGSGGGPGGTEANPPPTVVSVAPANNASAVDPNVQPTLNFSEALDRSTVTSSNIKLLSGASAIPGAVTFSGTSALFSPSSPLDLLGTYTLSATTDLKDTGGANLLTPFSSSFTVRDGVWGAAKDLGPSAASYDPVVGVDGAGRTLFVWVDSLFQTVFARWYGDGRWGEATSLFTGTDVSVSPPVIAVNSKVDALVAFTVDVFYTNVPILYTRQYRNGSWDLPSPALELSCGWPSVGMSPGGIAHVLCAAPAGLNARHTDLVGNWAAQATILVAQQNIPHVSFAFSSNDDALATWMHSDFPPEGVRSNIMCARFTSSQWGEATIIPGSQGETGDRVGLPATAQDTSGNTVAAWGHATGLNTVITDMLASRQSANGAWSTPMKVNIVTGDTALYDSPGLVYDGKDFVLAWNQWSVSGAQWATYEARNVAGVWQAATTPQAHKMLIPSVADLPPRLGVDARGNLVILWVEPGPAASDSYIQVSRYARATSTWSSLTKLNALSNATTGPSLAVGARARSGGLRQPGNRRVLHEYIRINDAPKHFLFRITIERYARRPPPFSNQFPSSLANTHFDSMSVSRRVRDRRGSSEHGVDRFECGDVCWREVDFVAGEV